jgi:hypothetical protein
VHTYDRAITARTNMSLLKTLMASFAAMICTMLEAPPQMFFDHKLTVSLTGFSSTAAPCVIKLGAHQMLGNCTQFNIGDTCAVRCLPGYYSTDTTRTVACHVNSTETVPDTLCQGMPSRAGTSGSLGLVTSCRSAVNLVCCSE